MKRLQNKKVASFLLSIALFNKSSQISAYADDMGLQVARSKSRLVELFKPKEEQVKEVGVINNDNKTRSI